MAMGPLKATAQGITFDEFGRPFIILKEQESQRRLTGLEAHKVWIPVHVIQQVKTEFLVLKYYHVLNILLVFISVAHFSC